MWNVRRGAGGDRFSLNECLCELGLGTGTAGARRAASRLPCARLLHVYVQTHRAHSYKLIDHVSSPKACFLVHRKSGYSHSNIDVDRVWHADPEADNMMLAKFRAADSAGLLLRVAPKHIDLTYTSS